MLITGGALAPHEQHGAPKECFKERSERKSNAKPARPFESLVEIQKNIGNALTFMNIAHFF